MAATLLGLIAGGLLLLTAAFFDDNGNGGDAATAGLLIVVPNALLATLLAVGATRLHGGHSSGRSLLTSAAVLDLRQVRPGRYSWVFATATTSPCSCGSPGRCYSHP